MDYSEPGSSVLHVLLIVMSIESMILSNHHPLSSPSFAFNLSSIRVFPSESARCIRWPKYWSFSFSTSPSSECSRLISFRIDRFDLAVQGTLKSLLQHYNSKASVLQQSLFFIVPTLTSVHDYWKKDSFDYTNLCQQSDVSAF